MKIFPHLPVVLCFSLLSSLGADTPDTKPFGEKIIRLPEFAVTETMKLLPEEKWLTGQIGNFEIFSNAGEKETYDFATKLYKFHQAFTLPFPQVTSISRDKITLILCGSQEKFLALAPLKSDEVDERYGNRAYVTLTDSFTTTFLINFDVKAFFGDGTSSVAGAESGPSYNFSQSTGAEFTDGETLLRQQYIRLLLSRSQPRPPAWLEEGVARYFDSLKIQKDKITFAQLDMSLTRYFSAETVGKRRMLSMADFFAVSYDSPDYLKSAGGRFSHQSLAFVHYGLLAHKGRYRKGFLTFIERACKEPVTESLFKACFNMSFRDMEASLSDYVQGGFYRHVVVPKPAELPAAPVLNLRNTTDAESGRMKGEVLRQVKRYDDARENLVAPVMRKNADASLLASLGILAYETQSYVAARKFLEEAVASKPANPAAYLTLARLRLEESLRATPDAQLTPAQLSQVLTPLFTALSLKKPYVEIYSLIADAWLNTKAVPTFENLAVLDEGVLAFPRNTDLILKNATLKARHGFTDDARSLIELGLKVARDTETKAQFEKLRSSLAAPAGTNLLRLGQ